MKNLTDILRPTNLNDIIGQEHIIGKGKIINNLVNSKYVPSMILYGPPGIGKTTIANAIANELDLPFIKINASIDGKKALQDAIKNIKNENDQIVLLIDEIHRLDKIKQDFLLPYTESGQIIMIGATIENPYFALSPAIRSRTQVFELKPLSPNDLIKVINLAQNETPIIFEDDAKDALSMTTNGDIRALLNLLTILINNSEQSNVDRITLEDVQKLTQKKLVGGDKDGDSHYDVISAFQKSIRGSDVDAALHYLGRLILSGDLQTIVRRLTVTAYEDIGIANPEIVTQAVTAINTAMSLGLPEARIPLAFAVEILTLSPKENLGYKALDAAIFDIEHMDTGDIPNDLKDTHYKNARTLGRGLNYKYPHDYPYHIIKQQYLPNEIKDKKYFQTKNPAPATKNMLEQYDKIKKIL